MEGDWVKLEDLRKGDQVKYKGKWEVCTGRLGKFGDELKIHFESGRSLQAYHLTEVITRKAK